MFVWVQFDRFLQVTCIEYFHGFANHGHIALRRFKHQEWYDVWSTHWNVQVSLLFSMLLVQPPVWTQRVPSKRSFALWVTHETTRWVRRTWRGLKKNFEAWLARVYFAVLRRVLKFGRHLWESACRGLITVPLAHLYRRAFGKTALLILILIGSLP